MNYYNEIKEQLINNEIYKKVKYYSINKSDLNTYYYVGKILSKAGKHYGEGIIKEYSKRLTNDLGKGYTETNLKYFRRFYLFSKSHTLCDELTWSHYRILLSISDDNEIKYKCYVVIELKVTELKKEHTGQIMTYMNYIDDNIKTIEENDTVGIIICKQDNEYVIKYCSDNRIISREYELV